MADQPLGAFTGKGPGIMRHGAPRASMEEKAVHDYQNALSEAGLLLDDLADNAGLVIIVKELEGLINNFLKTDQTALALLKVVAGWRSVVELAPRIAEKKVKKLLGPTLSAVAETQAAP